MNSCNGMRENISFHELIDLLHKSHTAPLSCPKMHNFVTEICTFLLQNSALWDICLILWDLWDGSIDYDLFEMV